MGKRGSVKQYTEPIQVRFTASQMTKLKVIARSEGRSVNNFVRLLVAEGLRRRIPSDDPIVADIQAAQKALIALEKKLRPSLNDRETYHRLSDLIAGDLISSLRSNDDPSAPAVRRHRA